MIMLLSLLSLPVYGSDNSSPKAVIVRVNIKNNIFTVLERNIVYGYPPEHFVQWQDFKIKLLSENGVIEEYGVIDPRIRFYETLPGGNPEGFGARMVDEANLTLIFPFNSNLTEVSVNNYTSGAELVKADLKNMIAGFCSQNKNDSDCTGVAVEPRGTPAAPPDFAPLTGLLVIIALVALGLWQLKRRK
ncbi:MAG: hypothetical protein Sv326_0336 [Candidatus Fermentimicrarchaeum limneticum]|uniref:Uncharacterized protein n=1 Tax=Fermentimicrarchaeum limneticum TaxID=2795018 RepID=A0A7D5XCD9_FERL1|nr:MAG: hypothetical protein Sv326_0336 [Candidatus Fermentimicrarchaeum limneticum]